MKLVYILLAAGFVKTVLLYKLYNSIPALELKRRARAKDKNAEALYKVAAYESSLDVLLWLAGTALGTVLLIWSARTSWWLAAIVIVISAWLIIWAPSPKPAGWLGSLAAFNAKYLANIVSFLHPLLSRIAELFPPASRVHLHTGMYEKKDLLDLLDKQNKQLDNRIDQTDLIIAQGALSFGDKLVSSIMTPCRKIKMVSADENIGPLLMDELHKSGHSRFPVVKGPAKSASPEIVGTLYMNDLIGHDGSGKVKDLARKQVYYINESANLRQALSTFLKTHHHMLIVVNNFEEIVGVVALEDVLEQIIGKPIVDEFDSYEDLRSAAAHDAREQKTEDKPVEPADQTEQTVVE